MSLQIAANHLAAQGRGPDTMLVHMAPSEVKSLQSIAMAHGGSLTINPQTGLPEAGFLSSILPMVAGIGLTALSGGTLSPLMAGLLTGGVTGVATGSLKKGLMAGLGAYGGAGLAGGLAQSGIQAGLAPELATAQAGVQQVTNAVPLVNNVPTLAPEAMGQYATDILSKTQPYVNASNAATQAYNTGSFADRLGTIGQGVKSLGSQGGFESFMQNMGGTKGLMQAGGAAAAPALASMMEPKTSTAPVDTEQYRYAYDPGVQTPPSREGDMGEYTYFRPSFARLNPTTSMAAGGGLMDAMPVERMSERNDAQMMMANGPQMYASGGLSHLGDYSDGGRLLRGPGDGVSDDIPATIANKRPARLADGEFVVPARIVSELGNGSTEAGARKLYSMMDRVQKNREKTVGKGKVAVNSRSEKLLPA
jgi:hypothetical protein